MKIRAGGPLRFLPRWALVSFNPKGPFQSLQSNLLKQIGPANMWVQSLPGLSKGKHWGTGLGGDEGETTTQNNRNCDRPLGPREMYIYDTLGGKKALFILGKADLQVVGAEREESLCLSK